jgi:hypothetical protein
MCLTIIFFEKINIYHRCKRGEKCEIRSHCHNKNISQYFKLNKKYHSLSSKHNLNDSVLIDLYEIFCTKNILIVTCINFFNYFLKVLETVQDLDLKELLIIYFYFLLLIEKLRSQKPQSYLFLNVIEQSKKSLVNLLNSPYTSVEFKSFMNEKIKPELDKI